MLFDSGTVTSNQQSYVHAAGLRLAPDHTLLVDRAHAGRRRASSVRTAADAHFDTGLADADWHASWIRRAGTLPTVVDIDGSRSARRLLADPQAGDRRREPGRARPVYAAAGQQYELHVNGTRVARRPVVLVSRRAVLRDDRRDRARARRSVRTSSRSSRTGRPRGQGRPDSPERSSRTSSIDHADGTRQVITTDGRGARTPGPWIPGAPRNDEGDFDEHIDERLDPDRLGPARVRRPRLARGDRARPASLAAVHPSRRGAHAHRRVRR